jgi:hypothetical protein
VFEKILNGILQHKHVESVIFLDSEGEEIFSYGRTNPEHLKLMGAYQGIILNSIERLALGENQSVITRCCHRSIVTQQLKLGYFVCVVLLPDANPAHARFLFQDYFMSLSQEL